MNERSDAERNENYSLKFFLDSKTFSSGQDVTFSVGLNKQKKALEKSESIVK